MQNNENVLNVYPQKVILLMAEILHQSIGSLSHYLQYMALYIPGGAGFLPSTVGNMVVPLGWGTLNNQPQIHLISWVIG